MTLVACLESAAVVAEAAAAAPTIAAAIKSSFLIFPSPFGRPTQRL
jgi:hypothetical protein